MRTVSISKGGQVDVSASKVLEIKEEIKMSDCFTKTQKSKIKQAWMDTVSHKQTNTNTKQTKRQSKLKQGWFGPVITTNKRYGKQETKNKARLGRCSDYHKQIQIQNKQTRHKHKARLGRCSDCHSR